MIWFAIALGFFLSYIGTGLYLVALGVAVLYEIIKSVYDHKSLEIKTIFKYNNTYIVIIMTVFALWWVSSILGIDDHALFVWAKHFGIAIFGIILYIILKNKPLPNMPQKMFIFQAIATVFSVWVIFDHSNIAPSVSVFLRGEDYIATYFSSILAMVLPFSLYACVQSKKPLNWAVPFLITMAIFVSGGRSGWLALVCMLVVFLFLFPFKAFGHAVRQRICVVLSVILGGIAGMGAYWYAVGTQVFVMRSAMSSTAGVGSGRFDIWAFGWDRFLESAIWGIGPRNFRHLDFTGITLTSNYHPHNIVIELLLETGIIGFVAFSAFILLIIKDFIVSYSTSKSGSDARCFMVCAFCALVAYGAASMTLTSIFHGWWFGYLVVLCVFIKLGIHKLSTNHSTV